MSKSRSEWKVGLFVLVGLSLLAALLIIFSQAANPFARTYKLNLRTTNVGGLIRGAKVMLAGVPVGRVMGATLVDSGKSVSVSLQIFQKFPIHADAVFYIEQAGFLGDQYVYIKPTQNAGPLLKDNDEVKCEEPFNLQAAARSAVGLIQRVDAMVQTINGVVTRVDTTVLSESTLTNISGVISNLHHVSDRAVTTIDSIGNLVQTNAPGINLAVSNVVDFSGQLHSVSNLNKFSVQLNKVADDLEALVSSNRTGVTASVKNIEESSESLKLLLADLHSGKGVAGSLVQDEKLQVQLTQMIGNLNTLSSNLNRFGLLYKPKPVKTNSLNAVSGPKDVYPKAR